MHAWKFIHIDQISGKKAYQRMGCGKQLIGEVFKLAKENGIETIALDTWSFNKEAQEFFKEQGFKPFNVRMWKVSV